QAEDGIRAKLVTGVQTCALPILLDAGIAVADAVLLAQLLVKVPHAEIKIFFRGTDSAPARLGHALGACRGLRFSTRTACQNVLRSEERRVGKGCGAPYMVLQ